VKRFLDRILRALLTGLHIILKSFWFIRRPKTFGVHAIPLTPEGRLVLVKLRYAPGWRVPGGGRSKREDPVDGALRELREEIGMTSHGAVEPVRDFDELTDFKRDTVTLVVVRDVRYRPGWSWEVEQVREVDPNSLPVDFSARSLAWIEAARPLL
jgi:8-oxo-dGTP pyrophosphatase MutT (NUDIX family)